MINKEFYMISKAQLNKMLQDAFIEGWWFKANKPNPVGSEFTDAKELHVSKEFSKLNKEKLNNENFNV